MRKSILRLLAAVLWTNLLFATHSSQSLSHETNETAYHTIKLYSYHYGLNFHDDETQPSRLHFYSDLGIHQVSEPGSTGAPKWVRVIRGHMKFYRVSIPEGKSEGYSSKSNGKRIKVVLLDENEQPIAGEPAFYHVTDFDGSEYRVHARAGEGYSVGFPLFKVTPEGEKHLFADSGFEVLLDENGHFNQFRDLSHLFIISYPEGKMRVLDKYTIRQLKAEKPNGYYAPKAGENPIFTTQLYHPEPDDHFKYMVHETYKNGQLESTTTWSRGENPYLFRFQTRKEGQDILERDDHYYKDENGYRNLNRNNYSDNGKHQLQRRSFHDEKSGWLPRYQRRVRHGIETIEAYKYIEDFETGTLVPHQTIHLSEEGKWYRKEYDDQGRVTMEWIPKEEVVTEEIEDPAIQELISLFPDPSEESINKHQVLRYTPEKVPDDLALAKTSGVVEYFGYESLSPDDKVTFEDTRPRFRFKLDQGKLIHRKWHIYGTRENGTPYIIEEESDDPDGVFGNETNRRMLIDYFGETHPIAPGKKSTVSYADGSMEVYYYDLGTWNPERKNFEVNAAGKELRTEITHGKLIDGVWGPGTTSRTLIQKQNDEIILDRKRELLADGSWKTVKES